MHLNNNKNTPTQLPPPSDDYVIGGSLGTEGSSGFCPTFRDRRLRLLFIDDFLEDRFGSFDGDPGGLDPCPEASNSLRKLSAYLWLLSRRLETSWKSAYNVGRRSISMTGSGFFAHADGGPNSATW